MLTPSLAPLPRRARIPAVLHNAIPGLLLAAALMAPFLNKAYTIDSPIFLSGARQVLREPFNPTDFTMVWMSDYPARASVIFSNSPLMFYLLAPVMAAGGAEWLAHLWMGCILCLGICATVSLGLRLGLSPSEAAWSGVLVAATPAVFVMATTAMPDIPAMTFGVLAVDRLAAWKQDGKWFNAVGGALLLVLAAFSRSHLILLAGVCLLWFLDPVVRSKWRTRLWPLLLPPLIFALGLRLNGDRSTGGLLQAIRTFSSARFVPVNLLAYLNHLVLVLPFTIPCSLLSRRITLARTAIVLAPACLLAVLLRNLVPWWVIPLAMLSAFVLADTLLHAWSRKDWVILFLGAWLLLPLPVLSYVHLPSKYLVPCAPAIALLVVLASRSATGQLRTVVLSAAVAAGVVLGLLIAKADYDLAGAWRRGAAELIAPRVSAGAHVWFVGTWGFYWYAERAGARPLSAVPPLPAPGDVIVSCASGPEDPAKRLSRKYRLMQHVSETGPGGRIFGGSPPAGFYSNYWGYLPWSWGRDPLTAFDVWRVE